MIKKRESQPPCDNTRSSDERLYAVATIERVFHSGRLLGHVDRTFYRKPDIEVDLDTFWDEFEDEPTRFYPLWKAEQFTPLEAERVVKLVRKEFPDLKGVSVKTDHCPQYDMHVPLRVYPNDGGYSQWDLSKYGEEIGFPIGSFADYEISNVMDGEPGLVIGLVHELPDRCALCEAAEGFQDVVEFGLGVTTTDGGVLCWNCSGRHAPELASRLRLAASATRGE